MDSSKFRKELKKVMPGYKWTIHKKICSSILVATGVQTAGKNRTSTLEVSMNKAGYRVKSSGFGCNSPWLHDCSRKTLKQALRALQDHYEVQASNYSGYALSLQNGRTKAV